MVASITSTSVSNASTPDPKAQFQEVLDSLQSLNKLLKDREVKWDVSEYNVLVAQLEILNKSGVIEGISTANVATMEDILRNMGRDMPENGPLACTTSLDKCDAVREMCSNQRLKYTVYNNKHQSCTMLPESCRAEGKEWRHEEEQSRGMG